MTVSSAMIIESANTNLEMLSESLDRFVEREFPPNVVECLDEHIKRLAEVVAALAVARYGISTRNPTFDFNEAEARIKTLAKGIVFLTED